ncbi:hypothetical protein ASG22_19030 [Chryseobacterium sp. Leaf405]|uniref:hypothetical protein n=1 Tax=Chryseobacterium sp. Leaf405 TaxID=1736367 RepID=UPI0006FFCE41|nr:hypothetical protein [Chryseobacterium sp. Leaf405]KQT31129.1 hypothetical protein ASG22_19030 [Chryseobacterium sp. Leaf405]
MISSEQEKQIALYLVSKKLHSQIIIEVKDHFISQISNLMETKNLNFQEAFLETKSSWKNELEMVNADLLSFRKITRLERNIMKPIFRRIMFFALAVSLLIGIVLSINENLYLYVQVSLLLVYISITFYNFFFKKMKFSEFQRMSFHPLLLRNILMMLLIIPVAGMIFSPKDNPWESPLSQMFLTYGILIQIQLLYFRTKKINVLLT